MRGFLSLMVIGAALAGSAQSAAQAQSLTRLRVAYDGYSMTSAPLYYAEHEGIFKKVRARREAGLRRGRLAAHPGGGRRLDRHRAERLHAGGGAAVQGADIVFIGGISNKLPFQLVVKSSIKGAADLKGQGIAISRYGSSTDTAADFALKHLGLTRNDVMVRQLGGPATRNAALISGQVGRHHGAVSRHGPARAAGLSRAGRRTDLAGDYPNTSYATSRTFLKNNPDAVKRFFMAMATAVHEFKRNPELGDQSSPRSSSR
jgi:ABC-type nitrate/sulfonate/bicarbonate transport systems, periplasmic components